MRILLFGRLQDLAGWRERRLDRPASSLKELRDRLAEGDPELGRALDGVGVQVAVDKALVRGDVALQPDTEVAFLPPMSGG